MNKTKEKIIGLILSSTALLLAFSANAQTTFPSITARSTYTKDTLLGDFRTIVNYVLSFVAVLAVLMIIYGGYLYITSGADESRLGKAKSTLIYGIIGVAIAILSFAIISFAGSLVSGQ